MNDQNPIQTDTTPSPDEFRDVFDAWIGGATLAERSMDIYAKPHLLARYEQLMRDLKREVAVEESSDESSLADSRAGEIEQELADLYEEWMASKSTWYIRALPSSVGKALSKLHPDVETPADLPPDADEAAIAAHEAAVTAFKQQADARNYAILEQTVTRIEFGDGRVLKPTYGADGWSVVKPAVTAAQLAVLRTQLGESQLINLITLGRVALVEEPVIPAPFLRANSSKGQTSR